MPMTSLWCFSIKRLGTRFAGTELFFSMKPFYSINRVLSVHRARYGRPFIHSPVRRLMGCQLGCGCAALGPLCLCVNTSSHKPGRATIENFVDYRRLRIYWKSLHPLTPPGEDAVANRQP